MPAVAATRTPALAPRSPAPAAAPAARASRSSTMPAFPAFAPPAMRLGGGAPLAAPMRRRLEKSFGADLGAVRVHSDTGAGSRADRLGAKAFAIGPDIVLGPPASAEDVGLMAHEAAHTIQQGSAPVLQRFSPGSGDVYEREAHRASEAAVRGESFTVRERSPVQPQCLSLNPLDYLADKANLIPGFRMFTIVLGMNPINMSRVARSAANILRALIELIPGGGLITQALENSGVFDKAGAFVETQIASLGMVGSAIKDAISTFIDSLGWTDLGDLGGVWDRAKRIFTEPIDRIINFAKGLVSGIVELIKDAILRPIAKLAEGTNGYALLKAVMGKDPITGDPVPQTAEAIIGPFMALIGQGEIWENMKKANAIPRAFAWFKGALSGLISFVTQIPGQFIAAFKSLELADIVLIPRAFVKLAKVFGSFLGKFFDWAGTTIWNLLEIIFAVVAPGVMPYLAKARAAFKTILKNPIGFVGNLVSAGKMGFQMFASRIGEHLKTELIKWIVGPLADAGVYIPKAFSLIEIVKLVLSVLGLTWQNIRAKLVKIIPEPVLVVLEKTAGILVTLVKDGPAAAWEQIKGELTELKDSLIAQMTQMITTEVVKAAVGKLVSMLNPAGAFVQAILAIYNTVTFFIEKINQIAAVVASFIDSISAIASGQIPNAARKVEQTMANTLVVVIGFLAKFAGLGGIPAKVVGIVKKIRQPIDKGLDKIVGWLGNMLKKLVTSVAQVGVPQDPNERLRLASRASIAIASRLPRTGLTAPIIAAAHEAIKLRYGLTELTPYQQGGAWFVRAVVNPPLVWRLPLPGETAGTTTGTGGIRSVAMQTGPGGAITTGVRGELSPGIPRQGFEANLPNAGNLPGLVSSYLQGYRRAHLYGPGFGDETAIGLMYASEQVNNELQSHGRVYGIEGYARQIRERVTALGGRVAVEVVATSFRDPPPGVPQALNQPVLRSVTYTFVIVNAQGNELRYRGPRATATITCAPPRANGAGGQGAVDYRHLIELNEYLGSRSQATGL